MPSAVQISGIPTKAKAMQIANSMQALYPDWKVEVIGTAAPYAVRRTPPQGGVAMAAVNAALASAAVPDGAAAPAAGDGDLSDAARNGAYGFLDFIAQYESRGNHNAYFAHAGNTDDPRFTAMTIDEVLAWQKGRKYSACGKYQIVRATLKWLKAGLGLTGAELYDPECQDRLALALLRRRGLDDFLAGTMSAEDFALSVAREWAALPGVKPPHGERSVYAGDGVNHAMVDSKTYLAAIARLKKTHKLLETG